MLNKSRPYIKKADLLLVLLVLLVSAAGILLLVFKHIDNNTPTSAEIKVNAKLVKTIDLTEVSEPYELKVEGKLTVTLEVSREGVRFKESECPDKLCIHSGLIEAGGSAACLPAGVSVTVKGAETPEVDGVVG